MHQRGELPLILGAPERLPVSIAATNRDMVSIRSTERPPHSHRDVTVSELRQICDSPFHTFRLFRRIEIPKISSVQNDISQLGSR
jgi:hypothetical protein